MRALALTALCLTAACLDRMPDVVEENHAPLAVNERREVELRYLRFDVVNYQKTLTRADILALPAATRERLWLLDLDLRNSARAPRLLDNSLAAIRAADPAMLSAPARNLQRLLKMTPDTADLQGTSLAQLIGLAPLLGIAPAQVLADMMNVPVDREFITPDVIAGAILENVIATHPNARLRPGPVTRDNPRGLYPVAPGSLPVTLEDAASDFGTLSRRFGPAAVDGQVHPGFIAGTVRARVLTDGFRMTVRANANALPYRGLDLTDASDAAVNPIASQIGTLFDFSDPNWLQMEGIAPGEARIDSMTFRVVEWNGFVRGGRSPIPAARGDSPAWTLPPWTLERVLMTAGQRAFANANASIAYAPPGRTDPLFRARVTQGWQEIFVEGGLGSPPPPSYLWDILLEVAQVRLHDGGLAEGMGNVEVELRDVRTGVDAADIERTIRQNLQSDPASLSELASSLIDNGQGAADFYYYRPRRSTSPDDDWLFFVTADDIPRDRTGNPARPYRYMHPGFYRDAALTQRVSTTEAVDGDTAHEKVRLRTAMVVYCQDDEGRVFRIDVGAKPSLARRRIGVTRVGR
ncbi:MAG: acetyltransferase [Polyangiales bacterium]